MSRLVIAADRNDALVVVSADHALGAAPRPTLGTCQPSSGSPERAPALWAQPSVSSRTAERVQRELSVRPLSLPSRTGIAASVLLLAAALLLVQATRRNYEDNVRAVAAQSLRRASSGFNQLSLAEVLKMRAVLETFVASNPTVLAEMAEGNRQGVWAATEPLFSRLSSSYGITNFNFIDPEEKRFVIMSDPSDPKLVGTRAMRFDIQEAARTKTWASGLALGFHGFALRVAHPVYEDGLTQRGRLLGYIELGAEISSFLATLQRQTGDEFGLLIEKRYLKADKWADSRKRLQLRDNWRDQPNYVLAGNTSKSEDAFTFSQDASKVPAQGQLLGVVTDSTGTWARSAFPVRDAAGERVGVVFVLADISRIHADLARTRRQLLTLCLGLAGLVTLLGFVLVHQVRIRELMARRPPS